MSDLCEPVFSGLACSFCGAHSPSDTAYQYEITTVPLNLRTAGVLQFTLGFTFCPQSLTSKYLNGNITISIEYAFHSSSCSDWTLLQNVRLVQ